MYWRLQFSSSLFLQATVYSDKNKGTLSIKQQCRTYIAKAALCKIRKYKKDKIKKSKM